MGTIKTICTIVLVFAFLALTGCTAYKTVSESQSEHITYATEQRTDSAVATSATRDSIRWVTHTKDSVNVYRMILLTQDAEGNVTNTRDIERTTIYHSGAESLMQYQKQIETLQRTVGYLRDSLQTYRHSETKAKEYEPTLRERIAMKAAPYLFIALALSATLNAVLLRRRT